MSVLENRLPKTLAISTTLQFRLDFGRDSCLRGGVNCSISPVHTSLGKAWTCGVGLSRIPNSQYNMSNQWWLLTARRPKIVCSSRSEVSIIYLSVVVLLGARTLFKRWWYNPVIASHTYRTTLIKLMTQPCHQSTPGLAGREQN